MSLLGFRATFQSSHLTLKGLYCIEIRNTPLALSTTHNRHTYFTLEFRVYIPYYLDVTRPDLNLMISGAEVNLGEYPGSG
jgi:hypothetical protein